MGDYSREMKLLVVVAVVAGVAAVAVIVGSVWETAAGVARWLEALL